MNKNVEAIDLYFRSGNEVPVSEAKIKKEEWEALKKHLENICRKLDQLSLDLWQSELVPFSYVGILDEIIKELEV